MNIDYINKENARIINKILGILQIAIGIFFLGIAPIEIYSVYLFSEGGRFYYDGFGIGSFLFGLIFAQIIAYYSIGLLFILIGSGHLRFKSWVLNLSIGCIWFWIIFGIPIMIFFLPLLTMKEITSQNPELLLTIVAIILIVIIPGLLLLFYKQKNVKELFAINKDSVSGKVYMPITSNLLLIVYCFYILVFHTMIFYHGLFPFLGKFKTGLSGILLYELSIIIMLLIIFGLIRKKYWSWILSIIYFTLLIVSTIITFTNYQYVEIIELLNFPKLEKDIFLNFPLKSLYLMIPIVVILIITIGIIIMTKKF